MFTRRVLVTSVAFALLATPVLAQGTQPSAPAAPTQPAKPVVTAPAKPAAVTATAPVAAKVNLNTASAADLDKLPHIGPARSKAIIEARGKERFKSWDDFVARKVVPGDALAAIKDSVTF